MEVIPFVFPPNNVGWYCLEVGSANFNSESRGGGEMGKNAKEICRSNFGQIAINFINIFVQDVGVLFMHLVII